MATNFVAERATNWHSLPLLFVLAFYNKLQCSKYLKCGEFAGSGWIHTCKNTHFRLFPPESID